MINRSWVPALLFLLVPVSVSAASGSSMQTDTDAWSSAIMEAQTDMSTLDTDIQFQNDSHLFPMTGTGTTQIPEDDFVTVPVDGHMITFGDVPVREWFAPYVRSIAELGLISGYRDASGVPLGTFGPADSVTLEQMTKVLLYGTGKDLVKCAGTGTLLNKSVSPWAHDFILCTEQSQWSVFGDGTVNVQGKATRAQVIATVLQAFDVQTGNTSGTVFKDVGSATLYSAAIERAQKDGIVSGYTDADGNLTGIFGPDDFVKRAEFAKMMQLALEVYGKK